MSSSFIGFFLCFLYLGAAAAQSVEARPSSPNLGPGRQAPSQKIKNLEKTAEDLIKRKQFDKAVETLKPSIENLDREGLNLLSKAYEGKKDWLNQIKLLNMIIGQNPKDLRALTQLGDAYLNNNQAGNAVTNYKGALEINAKYLPALEGLAAALKKNGNNYELRILFQEMVDTWGPKKEYVRELCRLNVEEGYFEPAAKYCALAVEKDPQYPDNHVYWAMYLKDSGDDKQAQRVLDKASTSFPKSELVQRIYGNLLEDQKNYIQAYKCFVKAAEADPNSYRAQAGLGRTSYELQKYDISLKAFEKACKLDRRTLQDFRTVASKLRTNRLSEWLKKFEYGIEKCGL